MAPPPVEAGGIWAAIFTPFRDDLSLDEDGIRRNVERFAALGLAGLFCNGLMGEFWSLDMDERRRTVELLVGAAAGRLAISPNVTHHSLRETIALARHAEATGADYAVLMNPSTGPRGEDALYDWYMAVADAVRIPLIIFNTPVPGYVLPVPLLARLAATGRFRALKATGGAGEQQAARRACAGRLVVSDPSEESWLANLLQHDQRLLYADPEPYLFQRPDDRPIERYFQHYQAGRVAEAVAGWKALSPVRRVYAERVIGPLRLGRMPNAALKRWAGHLGFAAGPVRPPLRPMTPDDAAALDAALAAVGAIG